MRKIIFLFLLITPVLGFGQDDAPNTFRKFGVGIGYHSNSVIGDSIRPLELSLRYRINDRHTLQLYTPLSYKRKSIRYMDDVRKYTLWGIGLGYDYRIYAYSYLNFFAGLSADYQWYQERYDSYFKDRIGTSGSYEVEKTYYYWHKVKGVTLNPNIGLRLSFGRLTSEIRVNVPFSKLRNKAYSYSEETVHFGNTSGEGFF